MKRFGILFLILLFATGCKTFGRKAESVIPEVQRVQTAAEQIEQGLNLLSFLATVAPTSIEGLTPEELMSLAEKTQAQIITYPLNAVPLASDQLLGMDTPGGAWSVMRLTIQRIMDLTTASYGPGTTATPSLIFYDSDAAGAADADEETIKFAGNMDITTEDAEYGSVNLQVMVNGSYSTFFRMDGRTANSVDGTYDGIVRTYTVDAGATSVFGQALHIDTDGELIVADGDVVSAGAMPAIGLAVEAGVGAKLVLTQGTICETDWSWTIGGMVFVSDDPTTTEGLTQTAISTTGDTVQAVGVASTADCIEVNMGGYVLVEVP